MRVLKSVGPVKIIKNNANKTFLLKWGISIEFFTKYYLKRGDVYNKSLDNVKYNVINILDYIKNFQ